MNESKVTVNKGAWLAMLLVAVLLDLVAVQALAVKPAEAALPGPAPTLCPPPAWTGSAFADTFLG